MSTRQKPNYKKTGAKNNQETFSPPPPPPTTTKQKNKNNRPLAFGKTIPQCRCVRPVSVRMTRMGADDMGRYKLWPGDVRSKMLFSSCDWSLTFFCRRINLCEKPLACTVVSNIIVSEARSCIVQAAQQDRIWCVGMCSTQLGLYIYIIYSV